MTKWDLFLECKNAQCMKIGQCNTHKRMKDKNHMIISIDMLKKLQTLS